jgi:hypothetical protein
MPQLMRSGFYLADDHRAVLMGAREQVDHRFGVHYQTVYVDERVPYGEVILGHCETVAGHLAYCEALMHPDFAIYLARSFREPVEPGFQLIPPSKEQPVTEANDIPRTAIEQRVINQHTEWMRENAFGLRLLDLTRMLSADMFGNETIRQQLIDDMGSQIALDAFRRGLSVMALATPQYMVHRHLGAWEDPDRIITPEPASWLPAPPPASMLEPNCVIEIKIEAYGFPIGKREV